MPELPEVEVTRRGLQRQVQGRTVSAVIVRDPRLRWPVAQDVQRAVGRNVRELGRRGKYLLIELGNGRFIIHLGMSGSLRVVQTGSTPARHDHVDIELGRVAIRLRDPRRFGAVLWSEGSVEQHPLLSRLGPEPLSARFGGEVLHRASRGSRVSIKSFLMDAHRVVGVGNIYASEALHRARINPRRAAGRLSRANAHSLAEAVKSVLRAAIRAGGSSLRDYVGTDGSPGEFQSRTDVYGREGEPCRRCEAPIRRIVQNQRATFYCPRCQR